MDDPTTDGSAEALVERLWAATLGGLELLTVHLGRELGLYALLADGRPRTAEELATEAGIAPRYAQEWLEQQAVAGFLAATLAEGAPTTFHLSPAHARVLVHPEDPAHVGPFATMVAGVAGALPAVADAFRSGDGVPFAAYGASFREGLGAVNRPAFTHDLPGTWLPAMPDVHERLLAGGRVADVGCGSGWSSRAVARAYPTAHVVAVDLDEASVTDARDLTPGDIADRITYVAGDAADLVAHGPFDAALVLEALHDMADPAAVLRAVREALAPGGALLVADELVADTFAPLGDEVERMMYGWSVTHCLPATVAEDGPEALGTVLRESTVRRLADEAGYRSVEVLPIDAATFRFYRLTP